MTPIIVRMLRGNLLLKAQFSATIAIGTGAATALVSVLLAAGYQPLPYRDMGRLVEVWALPDTGGDPSGFSGPDLVDFVDATHGIFASFGGLKNIPLWAHDARGATKIISCYLHESVFSDLGLRPVLGRQVRPDDETVGPNTKANVVPPAWISNEFWQSRYGGNPSVIGMTIGIGSSAMGENARLMRIAGVLPSRASMPLPYTKERTDVWYLLERDTVARLRQDNAFFGLGRLRPGVSVEQAQAALAVVLERLGQRYSFERGSAW